MNTDPTEGKQKEITEKIIGIFYKVYNTLGYGFLEKVYENAMIIEFEREGFPSFLRLQLRFLTKARL